MRPGSARPTFISEGEPPMLQVGHAHDPAFWGGCATLAG